MDFALPNRAVRLSLLSGKSHYDAVVAPLSEAKRSVWIATANLKELMIVDGARMYMGSANWTGAGLGAMGEHRRNFELGIVTDDERWIDAVQALYESIFRGQACQQCRLRDRCEAPLG